MATLSFHPTSSTFFPQADAKAVRLADGTLVIAWTVFDRDGLDGDIQFRRLTAEGETIGFDQRANTERTGGQTDPSIAALADGGFVITWQSAGQDGDGTGIFAQRFTSDGVAVGSEFQVNSNTAGDQQAATVTGLADGGWVVAWVDVGQDGSAEGIYQQRYSALGVPQGSETRVNSATLDAQDEASIAALQNGGWVVTWASRHPGDNSEDAREVFMQRYDAAGSPVGAETQVSSTGTGDDAPAVATLNNGDYVVAWFTNNGAPGDVFFRIYSEAGVDQSGIVNATAGTIADTPGYPAITALADGGFAISMNELGGSVAQNAYFREFDADGTARGDLTVAGAGAASVDANQNAIVSMADGGLGVVWTTQTDDILLAFHGQGTARDDIETMEQAGVFRARAGDDFVMGSNGDDTIMAGEGKDRILGRDGDDLIDLGRFGSFSALDVEFADGGFGQDTINGSSTRDSILGGGGEDVIFGRPGDDTIDGGNRTDLIFGGSGNDQVLGGSGDDVLKGGFGDDAVNGQDGRDIMNGQEGSDTLLGGFGHDRIWGGSENDILQGQGGSDRLDGGTGNDVLTGGLQADIFAFSDVDWGDDVITDFGDGFELINMKGSGVTVFGELTVTDLDDAALVEFGDNSILILGAAGQIDATDFAF